MSQTKATSSPIQKRKNRRAWVSVLPMTLFGIVFTIGPLIYLVALSFMQRTPDGRSIVAAFTFNNYKMILNEAYRSTFLSSIKLALISTLFTTVLGYPFGYFMAKLTSQWKGRVSSLLMIPFWVNSLLRLNGWAMIFRANGPLDRLVMFLGISNEPLGLAYSYPVVVIGMVYVLLPFMIFSVYSSAEKLDWSLIEASRDLGSTPFQAFITISLPLTIPGLLSGIILTFIPSMGLFFIADILGGNKVPLVGTLIYEQSQVGHNTPFAAALSVVLMALTSLFIWGYRKITNADDLEGIA